jgi:hypothetical protein
MTEETKLERKSLIKPLASIRREPVADATDTITVAEAHGFDNVPMQAREVARLEANQSPTPPRRKRGKGRTLQFNVKLDQPTIDYIYGIANDRDIPLAQVIEELVDTHSQRGRGSKSAD